MIDITWLGFCGFVRATLSQSLTVEATGVVACSAKCSK